VIQGLQRYYVGLTQAQKRIAEAIVEDPDFVAFATVDKLASRLGVASSTIVRFCYRLGLDGYPDLQEQVRRMVRARMRSTQVSGVSGSEVVAHLEQGTVSQSLEHDLENLSRTILELESDVLDRVITRVTEARRVYLLGGHASDWLAEYGALSLNRIRGSSWSLGPSNVGPLLLDMTADDVLIALSFPPYASQTVKVVEAARSREVSVIAVTDSPISPVGRQADLTLNAHVSGTGPQNSLIGPLAIINAVLNGIVGSSEDLAARYRQIFSLMDEWDAFILRSETGSDA
jgi:DNA-binding MurR/RpiR family transcriptional regulator